MKNTIIQGNCLDVLKTMPDNHIDTIITDPPYGLSFMGKKWDYDVPSIDIWKECLRVLKPGGTALIFAGSRTQHRMACNVEDAGFILKDTIMWLYGSGFPKATDISKQLDKGVDREVIGYDKNSAPDLRDVGRMSKESTGIDKMSFGQCGEIAKRKQVEITKATTPEGKLWNGWKSHGLKPAYEPILVAMKPNDGSYAENALKWGVSGLNIDGGRISHNEPLKETNRKKETGNSWDKDNCGLRNNPNNIASASPQGRFPANIILDEEAGKMLDEQSGESVSSGGKSGHTGAYSGGYKQEHYGDMKPGLGDKGGASRFFYCAKASKSERNIGCEGLEEKKVSDGREKEADNAYQRGKTLRSNTHPTVKPLKLMEYLCTLTKTPTGGIVLDPFCGSGTTLMAAKLTGRDYIGIEREQEYVEIAKCRVDAVKIDNDLFK